MKYTKFICGVVFCCSLSYNLSEDAKADYFTEYNVSVMDTVLRKDPFNLDILGSRSIYSPPKLNSSISIENITELDYSAELLNYNKKAYNYLVLYSLDDNKIPIELFRIPINKSGEGKIVDRNLLRLIRPNTKIILNVISYEIDNKGNIGKIQYSNISPVYYAKKTLNLVVKEDNKEVINRIISLTSEAADDKVFVYPYEIEQYHRPSRYYSYENAELLLDDKKVDKNNLSIPYNTKKIEVNLSKNKDYWNTVKIEYPEYYKNENVELDIKRNTTIANFLNENRLKRNFEKNDNYEFSGYYISENNLDTITSRVLNTDTTIKAKFKTKIVLDNGQSKKELSLLTGDKLTEIDTGFFEKEKYHVESYTLYRNSDNEKIKEVKTLIDEQVDESITIKPNYKENTNVVSVRQDDYNKRFGRVDDSIQNADIKWEQTKKIGELLNELREKIKPSTGYQTVFRVNKKVVNDDDYITDDIILEIYFKKIEEDWVTVKFVGKGIDKFLSDGQEILADIRIDSMINLPTATGETSREFLGWQASADYFISGENSNKVRVSKNKLLQTNELGSVVTEKGQNLEFTAIYRKIFNVEFEPTQLGKVSLSKGIENILEVDEFNSIGETTKNNKIIVEGRSGYSLSHFVANKTVKVNTQQGTKEIFTGQKIEEEDLYNIVPTSDLKITPIFTCELFSDSLSEMLENNKIKTVEDVLNLKFESTENIRRILGPLYYLR